MGRNLIAAQLTESQAEFVRQMAQGVSRQQAAALAGYAHPKTEAYRLLQLPHVVAALKHEHSRLISADLLPLAIGRLKGILEDKTAPTQHVVKAAVEVIKVAGLHKQSGEGEGDGSKPLISRSRMELEDLVTRLESAVHAHEAKTVDAVPDSVSLSEPDLDSLIDS
jgi:hypothetical protein